MCIRDSPLDRLTESQIDLGVTVLAIFRLRSLLVAAPVRASGASGGTIRTSPGRSARTATEHRENIVDIRVAAVLEADARTTVSYTHLDVYKRQALNCAPETESKVSEIICMLMQEFHFRPNDCMQIMEDTKHIRNAPQARNYILAIDGRGYEHGNRKDYEDRKDRKDAEYVRGA